MSRKNFRILSLCVIVCCLYSLYKIPSLYWSLKLKLSLEKHHYVTAETENQHSVVPTSNRNAFSGKNLAEKFNQNGKETHVYHEVNNTKVSVNNSERKVTNLESTILNASRVGDESQDVKEDTKKEYDVKLDDTVIDNKEAGNKMEDTKPQEKKTWNDLQNAQFQEVLRGLKENEPSHYDKTINDEKHFDGQFVYEKEDVEFDMNDLDAYRNESEKLFKTFPNHQNATKYLIYYCNEKCGGLGDRLKGITAVYMMSILTERRFAISMTTPCEIERFLQPNLLDWRYPSKEDVIGKTLQTLDCFERHDAYEIDFQKYDPDPKTLMQADLVQMKANQDWTRIFRKMSVTPKRFPQLYQYHSSELLKTIFNGLFKLSPDLENLVYDFFIEKVNGKKLACLHARMGEEVYQRYTYREILIPLQFLKQFDTSENYKIMVATDTENVKAIANHMFKSFVDTSGPILHIDYMVNGTMTKDRKCAGFMRSMVDHTVLQRCDQLVLTGSGFGVTAASIRHTSSGLHVYMRGEAVMPTRRELIRETFQWRCLAPSWDMKFYRNICDS